MTTYASAYIAPEDAPLPSYFGGFSVSPFHYVANLGMGPTPDTDPPVVSNVTPAAGVALARTDPIFFDVTDDASAFRRIIVVADFADGSSEVVHDGDNFAARYAATSGREPITDGFRYRIRRTGGWPYGPSIRAFAIDVAGNENL